MSDIHVTTSGPKSREMVAVVLEEFDKWAKFAPGQAAGVVGGDYAKAEEAARAAIADIRAELADHLVIPVGLTIASWRVEETVTP